jgi:hypothetical protein
MSGDHGGQAILLQTDQGNGYILRDHGNECLKYQEQYQQCSAAVQCVKKVSLRSQPIPLKME